MANPHVLVVPYPAQGHVIPLLELSRCLAEHGVKVTFVNTECMQMKEAMSMEEDTSSKVHQVFITAGFDSLEDRKELSGKLTEEILRVLPQKLEELIEDINGSNGDSITCVLVDQTLGWALEIAEKKVIKRAAYSPAAAALTVLGLSIPKLIDDGVIDDDGTPTKKEVIKLSPDMPAMNTHEFAWACLGNKAMQKSVFELMLRNNKSRKSAEWLLCNSSYDLEPAAFTMTPHILPIGPLLASNRLKVNFAGEDSCLTWLDQQATQSVVYVAFGSLAVFNPIQFKELALAIELSNRPLLWVVRSDMIHTENEDYLKEFNGRVATRASLHCLFCEPLWLEFNHGRFRIWSPFLVLALLC